MFKKMFFLTLSLCLITSVSADVVWDFENGNDHRFDLWSVFPAVGWTDDPTIAGDEAITGVGGHTGLPDNGVAWCVGRPDQYDGQKPAVDEGDKVKADGTMEYNQPGKNHPFTFPVNDRGQESYLNTYNLTQWGDNVHVQANDQIATSPPITLGEGAVLTVWSHGGGSGTHAPEYDADPVMMYTDGSSGIAVLSADEEDKWALLASMHLNGRGTLTEDTLDLSAFAGKQVLIDVVDAFEGGWGWIAVDEIQVTNALQLPLVGFVVQTTDGVLDWGFDAAQVDHLKTLGYDVQVIDMVELNDGTFTTADANALDLLLISESIGSSSADPLIGTTTPMMHQEAYGWDNWSFMGAADNIHWITNQTEVEVVNDTHPIMVDAGFSVGMLPWYTAPDQYTTENISNLAPGAELLCKAPDEDSATVFAIEEGAELANGEPSPNRVVGFSIPGNRDGLNQVDGIIDASIMADEQWALYDAAIRWLNPPPTAAMIVSAADLSAGFDQAQHDRLVSMGYAVKVVTSGDVGSAFTVDDADNCDLLLVSESIGSSSADPLIGTTTPTMHNESYGWDNWLLTTRTNSTWITGSDVDIVNDTHPIAVAAGLSAGSMPFYSLPSDWTTELVSALAPGAEIIAQVTSDSNDFAIVFTVDQEAELVDGSASPNRIAGFSLPGQAQLPATVMTDEAWALWEATINWLKEE